MENYTSIENVDTVAEPQLALWQDESITNKNNLRTIIIPQKHTQNYQKLNLESLNRT